MLKKNAEKEIRNRVNLCIYETSKAILLAVTYNESVVYKYKKSKKLNNLLILSGTIKKLEEAQKKLKEALCQLNIW